MTRAPLLSPSFIWIPAQSHSDPAAFRERQRARMAAAQKAREEVNRNVKAMTKGKA